MSKCVANLYRYVEVCLNANRRYLDALSCVDNPGPSRKELTELSEPVVRKQRRLSGFNPVQQGTTALFKEVLSGDYIAEQQAPRLSYAAVIEPSKEGSKELILFPLPEYPTPTRFQRTLPPSP